MEAIEDLREFASEVAKEAGRLLKGMERPGIKIDYKGAIDLVTEADLRAEGLIIRRIKEKFPDHAVLSEEVGGDRPGAEHLWIVDPLDGTTNYAHSYPIYAVSIAVEMRGEVVAGAVYDPTLDELFAASKGSGASLNGSEIRVSGIEDLDKSLLATGFPYYYRERPHEILALFKDFLLRAQGIRRAGSAALDLCALACGRFDGFWELGLKPWDTAAGSLILTEAGGAITKMDGTAFDIRVPELLASNGAIHEQMLAVVKGVMA